MTLGRVSNDQWYEDLPDHVKDHPTDPEWEDFEAIQAEDEAWECIGPEGDCGIKGPGHFPPCPLASDEGQKED